MSLIKNLKSFLNGVDLEQPALKKRRQLFALIIDLSFFPQAVWAALLYYSLMKNPYFMSRYLIYGYHADAMLFSCAAIVVLALLCLIKRYYIIRLLLIAGYMAFLIAVRLLGFSGVYLSCTLFAVFGIIVALLNLTALYGYKQINKKLSS